jgi:signal transduction histidine kinase
MDGKQGIDLGTIVIFGTMGMIILAMGIIVFFFIYQKRMVAKQNELALLDLEHQKELMGAVIQTKELEQRRIALELHDDVGSTLTAIKFSIPRLNITTEEKELLNANLANAIQKVRRISNDLLPSILEELGLITASRNLIKTLNETTDLIYTIECPSETIPHPKDVELAFYRVMQELLNNILKYAEASIVGVTIVTTQSGIRMTISDDGKGFIPSDHTQRDRPSLGLKNMESRIQQIKGTIRYEKGAPKGTKVTIEWKAI